MNNETDRVLEPADLRAARELAECAELDQLAPARAADARQILAATGREERFRETLRNAESVWHSDDLPTLLERALAERTELLGRIDRVLNSSPSHRVADAAEKGVELLKGIYEQLCDAGEKDGSIRVRVIKG